MNKFTLSAITLATAMTPALAMSEGATEVDANGDGVLSVEEVQAVWPDMTAEQFAELDTDGDGALNDAEVMAAEDAGMMTTEE